MDNVLAARAGKRMPGRGVTGNPRIWSSAAGYGPCCPDCYDRLSE